MINSKLMNNTLLKISMFFMASAMLSCVATEDLETRLENIEGRIEALEEAAGAVNETMIAVKKLCNEDILVVGLTEIEYGYRLELSDGTTVTVIDGIDAPGIVPMIGIDGEGRWIMSTDGGMTFTPIQGATAPFIENGYTPQVKIDSEGWWLISTDGGSTFSLITAPDGKHLSALGATTGAVSTFFSGVSYDEEKGLLTITLRNGETLEIAVIDTFGITLKGYTAKDAIYLNYTRIYKVELSNIAGAILSAPEGWNATLTDTEFSVTAPSSADEGEYDVDLVLTSPDGYIRRYTFTFTLIPKAFDPSNCKEYNDFLAQNPENLLLDFSYAGYMHGESAPLEAAALGYTIYDVTEYGAVADDGISDREAFLRCVEAATGKTFAENDNSLTLASIEKANAIIYFPEGEFILHTAEDNHTVDGKTYSRTIQIRAGNFVLRGAGRDRTTLVMQDCNLPTDEEVLYSSPAMLDFKHNSGLGSKMKIAVTANAAKGAFAVEVEDASALKVDSWVCLSMQNNDPACVAAELAAGSPTAAELAEMTDIVNNGVKIYEYHQIRYVEGNKVTFHEPLMHEVDLKYTAFTGTSCYNWSILDYPHYENVGIEDFTFKGNAKDDFVHHGSWKDDGAYKPLGMTRLVNSWLRRVRFTSVSEACSVTNSANVSVYDIIFDGNRGHSSIRSQASTRVFIGATVDKADGHLIDSPDTWKEGAGQYHAVGVSKPSIGTVLWRNTWGSDSCFESHATQPRATLIDCCTGGWMKYRQGGDQTQVPNHLADLTVWNFCSLTPQSGTFGWWDHNSYWWKFLPPVIVGFHGEATAFDADQVATDSSNGVPVAPGSLYEAQLKERLGNVPGWLESLK